MAPKQFERVSRFSLPNLANYFISFQRKSISPIILIPVAQTQGACGLVVDVAPLGVFHGGAAFPLQIDQITWHTKPPMSRTALACRWSSWVRRLSCRIRKLA